MELAELADFLTSASPHRVSTPYGTIQLNRDGIYEIQHREAARTADRMTMAFKQVVCSPAAAPTLDQTRCCLCWAPDAPRRCARCHRSRYCDRECQKLDWSHHKLVCRPACP